MNFLQLEYFMKICEQKSVTWAAEKLFISQSALSQQLLRLEKDIGVPLFNRLGNKLILTEAGEQFQEYARNILFEYHNIENLAQHQADNTRGELSVAVTKTKSFITLTYLLAGFRQVYPNIRIRIVEVDSNQVEDLLIRGEIDLGFCYGHSDIPLNYVTIFREPVLLAVPPHSPLGEACRATPEDYPRVTFDQIRDEPFLIGTDGFLRHYTLQLFEKRGATPNIVMETSNPGLVHLLVAANTGLAFIGQISSWIKPEFLDQPVYCILEGEEDQRLMVSIAYHRRRYVTAAMKLFIDYATASFQDQKFLPLHTAFQHAPNDVFLHQQHPDDER